MATSVSTCLITKLEYLAWPDNVNKKNTLILEGFSKLITINCNALSSFKSFSNNLEEGHEIIALIL